MHTLGKVLAFLVVIAAIAASVLTSKLVQVRNSWTAKTVASKAKTEKLLPQIEQKEAEIESLKNEIFRSRELWGAYWQNVQTDKANPADGTLQVGIGTDQSIREKMILHGFEIAPDNSTIYRGSFTATAVQNGAATLKPNWRVTADDVKTWTPGPWRWRNALPSGFQDNFERLSLTLLKHEETLKARQATLAGQKDLLAKANNTLKLRETELVGGEMLGKAPNVEPEFREGLVPAIEKTEEERNQSLRKIDELRRKIRNIQAEVEQLQADNIALAQRLPEPSRPNEVTQKAK